MNCELADVQAGFRKGRGTRDQTANIRWIIKKLEFQRKTSISALLTRSKPLTVFSSVQSLSHGWLFVTPWIAACQASPSITNSQTPSKPMPNELAMPSDHLIFCHPRFLLPSIFPSIRSFQTSQLYVSGGQSIGVSASKSVLTMNTQDWSHLGWTGWISLQSKGLSGVFSNTTVQKHLFLSAQLSL